MTQHADANGPIEGGTFLLEERAPSSIKTYEDLDEEQHAFARTAREFMENEVLPRVAEIEVMKGGVLPGLLRQAGEIGLLMADIPEEYGGLGLDKTTVGFVHAQTACMPSFAVAFGGQVGIGTVPILYFGTPQQKEKYLPRLASGELLTAYALTEPNSGSDALGARTKAVLTEDGRHWRLDGTKQFITNAGFADIFIVFAKVDGEKFSCFIVERDTPGLTVGPEEKKMGLRGSSTCTLILEDALVPRENLLGEVGKGHVIAFNTLNLGRLKLGHKAIERSKFVLGLALSYIAQRKQFGKTLNSFGAIRKKVARIVAEIYAGDAMAYRLLGDIDAALSRIDPAKGDSDAQKVGVFASFSLEAAILKVLGTEILAHAVDEGVQMFGGYGFIEEYPIERFYRDSRVERIFEGTNEINRILLVTTIAKRAMQGELDLSGFLQKIEEEGATPSLASLRSDPLLGAERYTLEMGRRAFARLLSAALEKYGSRLREAQYVVEPLADLAMTLYAVESAILRTRKMAESGRDVSLAASATRLHAALSFDRFAARAMRLLPSLHEGESKAQREALTPFLPWLETDLVPLQEQLALAAIEANAHPFDRRA
ncbi:MAG: acyl-CoA dehydrogenase [Deltaproteobacteria bacterium]|nr:MAG: acyl-CoA dehydrogenase [Deltaproteobacteria bacterium]